MEPLGKIVRSENKIVQTFFRHAKRAGLRKRRGRFRSNRVFLPHSAAFRSRMPSKNIKMLRTETTTVTIQ